MREKTLFLASVRCRNHKTHRVIFHENAYDMIADILDIYNGEEYPNTILEFRSVDSYTRYYSLTQFARKYSKRSKDNVC